MCITAITQWEIPSELCCFISKGPNLAHNSPFCVQAKIIKLVGLKYGGRLSPINLVTFAGPQNGE
jgi:hypothetical protein